MELDALQREFPGFEVQTPGGKVGPEVDFYVQLTLEVEEVDHLLEIVTVAAAVQDDKALVGVLFQELTEISLRVVLVLRCGVILVVAGVDVFLQPGESE